MSISDLGPLPAANKLKFPSSGSETIFNLRDPSIKQQLSLKIRNFAPHENKEHKEFNHLHKLSSKLQLKSP